MKKEEILEDNNKNISDQENKIQELEQLKKEYEEQIKYNEYSIININQMKKTYIVLAILLTLVLILSLNTICLVSGYSLINSLIVGFSIPTLITSFASFIVMKDFNFKLKQNIYEKNAYNLELKQLEENLSSNKELLKKLYKIKDKLLEENLKIESNKKEIVLEEDLFETNNNKKEKQKTYSKNKKSTI